jgi:hypothetical protein
MYGYGGRGKVKKENKFVMERLNESCGEILYG